MGCFTLAVTIYPNNWNLLPKTNGQDGVIELNEANKKRYKYNKKRFGINNNYETPTENTNRQSKNDKPEYTTFKSIFANANAITETVAKNMGNNDNAVKYMRTKFGKMY